MRKFKLNEQVKLSNPYEHEWFKEEYWDDFSDNWKKWWMDNLDTQFTVIEERCNCALILSPIPEHLDPLMEFWSHEVEGDVRIFQDEDMFKL